MAGSPVKALRRMGYDIPSLGNGPTRPVAVPVREKPEPIPDAMLNDPGEWRTLMIRRLLGIVRDGTHWEAIGAMRVLIDWRTELSSLGGAEFGWVDPRRMTMAELEAAEREGRLE